MKKYIIIALTLTACSKKSNNVWNCKLKNKDTVVISKSAPIIKTKNEFGNDVCAYCEKVNE